MYGLRILDPLMWRDDWSAQIGRQLEIVNSTYNLLVFDDQTGPNEIRAAVRKVPREAYNLIKIHPSTSGLCEILTDDGQCFERD